METRPATALARSTLFDRQIFWLHQLVNEGQLLADLAFADIVFWAPTQDGSFVAVSHLRPSSAATLFYRDIVESEIHGEWVELVESAFTTGKITDSGLLHSGEETPSRIRAVPIRVGNESGDDHSNSSPIAVLTRHSNLSDSRLPSRQELTFNQCANDLFVMVSNGFFPDPDAPSAPAQGAPRAPDGLIRLDEDGKVVFASPNALSAFRRLGYRDELENEALGDVVAGMLQGTLVVDESLPLVAAGKAPWRSDFSVNDVTVALRSIPLRDRGARRGAIVLTRDVTQLRTRERQMLSKDATIREIHHRVKNNLQTVASLLRIQARRTRSAEAREALGEAMRRVSAIAVVHDTLSEGLSQSVDFDDVFERVLVLAAEVASGSGDQIKPMLRGSFGILKSEFATPLALVLTELITNAVEHGLRGVEDAKAEVVAKRAGNVLKVSVRDNGIGLPTGTPIDGLGTQIIRTLVEGELGGSIHWRNLTRGGTEIVISVPLKFMT